MAKKLTEDHIKWILSLDASEAEKGTAALAKKNVELTNRNKDLKKSMQQLEAQGKINSENYRKLSEEYKRNSEALSSNREVMKALERQMGVNNLAMSQLKRRSQDLQRQLDNTSQALHPAEWNKLNTALTETKDRMSQLKNSGKEIDTQLGQAIKSSGKWAAFLGNMMTKAAEWGGQLLVKMKDIALEGITMAESADGVTRAFRKIDDGAMLDNLREATKGTVTDLELMKAAVKAKDFRIPLDDLGKYLQFAQLKAQQTGQSVEYMTDSIVTGLGRRSVLILDNLGLSAAEINEQVSQTGDFMSAVASIVDKQLTEAGGNYVSAADRATQKTVEFQNAQRELGEILLPLKQQWDDTYGDFQVSTMQLIGWIVKHRASIGLLATTVTTYLAMQKVATLWNKKYAESTIVSIATEKLHAIKIDVTRRAYNAKLIAMMLYTRSCSVASAATDFFNKVLKVSPLGLITTLATTAAAALLLFGNKTSKVSEVTKEANQSISDEKNRLDALKSVLFDSSKSYKERQYALTEIQKIVPKYHASLTEEGRLINNNAEALDGYVEKLLITAKQQAANTKLQEALNERSEWIGGQDKSEAMRFKSVEWEVNDPMNANKSIEEIAASQGVSPTAYRVWSAQKKQLDENVKLYEDMMKEYVQQLANVDSKYTKSGTNSDAVDLIESKKKEIEQAEKEIASTYEEVKARNKKVAALKAELEVLQNLGLQKKKNSGNKNKETAAEKEKKAVLDTEKSIISEIEKSREEDLLNQQRVYNDSIYKLNLALAKKEMTQEDYDLTLLAYDRETAENRLQIEQEYYKHAESLQLTNSELREEFIRDSNKRIVESEKTANMDRATELAKMNSLIKDFKSQFKITTVDEDYGAQKEVLSAAYEARKKAIEKEIKEKKLSEEDGSKVLLDLKSANDRALEQLELDHQQRIQSMKDQYGLSTQKERLNAELAQLKAARDQGLLQEEDYETAVQNLKRDSFKQQFDYYSNLFSGAVQALQQAEMDNVDAQYDAEIEAAQGNSEEVERLEKEKAQKKLDIQKKYADVNFAIKVSQIIADTSVSIMKAFADLGPIAGAIAAALMGATGLAQIASANAERQKVKNMTLSGSSKSKGGARVATGREEGGKIDVRRAQDGKLFPGADYDPDARGFIDRPTVIVGEGPHGQSREWVASNAAVANPTVAPFLNLLDQAQQAGTIRTLDLNQAIRARMAGFSSGGSVSSPLPVVPNNSNPDSGAALSPEMMLRLAKAIISIDENGVPASVSLTELDRKQQLLNRSRSIGSK